MNLQVTSRMTWADPVASDKHYWHRYSAFYKKHLEVHQPVNAILEYGVFGGASIRWLRDLYPRAEIFGVDILSPQPGWPTGPGITYITADQSDRIGISNMLAGIGHRFDLVIEDGSHIPQHQAICLAETFLYLRSGGLYILEDLHTSHPKHSYYVEHCAPGAPTSLSLILQIEHLRAVGKELLEHDKERLAFSGLFTSDDIEMLASSVADVDIYQRSTLPLRCYACGNDEFDSLNFVCRCGVDLDITAADSMTAVLRRGSEP